VGTLQCGVLARAPDARVLDCQFCRIVKRKIVLSREKLEKSTLIYLLSICVTRKFNKHSITKHRHALKKKENIERGFKQVVCVASFNDLRFIDVSPQRLSCGALFPFKFLRYTALSQISAARVKITQETLPPPSRRTDTATPIFSSSSQQQYSAFTSSSETPVSAFPVRYSHPQRLMTNSSKVR
jgi:hypothetical protein